jgi:phosphotransferase system enzyme I (PtsI)
MTRRSHFPANTLDGIHVQVLGNIELPEEVVAVRDNGGDGIGLYRTEFQYLRRAGFPDEDELFDKYRDVVEVMNPHPVTIRTLDINGDKAIAKSAHRSEQNPALGLRAIRYCLKKPEVFRTQLRAILRASAFGHVRIMFPMISSVEEIIEAKHHLELAAESLDREGKKFRQDIEIGIMIEVPSAVILADLMAKEVDFFSIGTNDLIQYSLAIDRGNQYVNYLYQPLHPAVLRMLKTVSDVAENQGIKLCMCGEMAGDPIYMPLLLGFGICELSMNPLSVPAAKSMIRALNLKESQDFVRQAMKFATAAQISNLVQDTYGNIVADKIYGR